MVVVALVNLCLQHPPYPHVDPALLLSFHCRHSESFRSHVSAVAADAVAAVAVA